MKYVRIMSQHAGIAGSYRRAVALPAAEALARAAETVARLGLTCTPEEYARQTWGEPMEDARADAYAARLTYDDVSW